MVIVQNKGGRGNSDQCARGAGVLALPGFIGGNLGVFVGDAGDDRNVHRIGISANGIVRLKDLETGRARG